LEECDKKACAASKAALPQTVAGPDLSGIERP
jgi:hypothetical protein